MNKKEIAQIRKEFKINGTMLHVKEMYTVYLKANTLDIVHSEHKYFNQLDEDIKELYYSNFKKVLSSAIDTKMFELEFISTENKDNTQQILYNSLKNENKEEIVKSISHFIDKIKSNLTYPTDIVVNFIWAEYWKGSKKRKKEEDESIDDNVSAFQFMLCSINNVEFPKRTLKFDRKEKEFTTNSTIDSLINLKSPINGFMFPVLNNSSADVNKIMYYNAKKEINTAFVEKILNCKIKSTCEDEKALFNELLQNVLEEGTEPELLQNMYCKIDNIIETSYENEDEKVEIGYKDLKEIFGESGFEISNLENIFKKVVGNMHYKFNAENIIPSVTTKSIKIKTEAADILIMPGSLEKLNQIINKNGEKFITIEILNDITIDGIKFKNKRGENLQ